MKTGIDKIKNGECPLGAFSPMTCMFCEFGHMTECHYPMNCEEANCSHYQAQEEQERYDPNDDIEYFRDEDGSVSYK